MSNKIEVPALFHLDLLWHFEKYLSNFFFFNHISVTAEMLHDKRLSWAFVQPLTLSLTGLMATITGKGEKQHHS